MKGLICNDASNGMKIRGLALKTRWWNHRDGYQKRYAQYAVAYAAGKTIDPENLFRAGIGFMPIGKNGHCLEYYTQPKADKDWETTYGVSDWEPKSWRDAYGIQIYTGEPSGYLTSLDFEYAIIRDHPQHFLDTLSRLCELTENPLLVITKSGGLRFECRTPGYVHSKTDQRYVATWKKPSRASRPLSRNFRRKRVIPVRRTLRDLHRQPSEYPRHRPSRTFLRSSTISKNRSEHRDRKSRPLSLNRHKHLKNDRKLAVPPVLKIY